MKTPVILGLLSLATAAAAPIATIDPQFRREIEADWSAQEQRRDRQPHQPPAICAALQRARQLLVDLRTRFPSLDCTRQADVLEELQREAAGVGALDDSARSVLYRKVRWAGRELALKNPLLADRPLVFMKRHRFVCQMLHEYLGYFYDYGDVAGGGIHVLEQPGQSFKIRDLVRARLLLGTVPVEADGSAHFRAPARKPLYFQSVDDTGRAVQTMRSITFLQPGERRGCVGCHEPPGTTAAVKTMRAALRPASRLEPGPDGSRPLSYPRLVQPVLNRHCVRCHDGTPDPGKGTLALTSERTETFTRSYDNLKPFVRWHEWGGASISQTATRPGHCGADESRLTQVLDDATHAPLRLPDADRRRLYLWLDANAPFYGTYSSPEQLAQRNGEAVPIPRVQ